MSPLPSTLPPSPHTPLTLTRGARTQLRFDNTCGPQPNIASKFRNQVGRSESPGQEFRVGLTLLRGPSSATLSAVSPHWYSTADARVLTLYPVSVPRVPMDSGLRPPDRSRRRHLGPPHLRHPLVRLLPCSPTLALSTGSSPVRDAMRAATAGSTRPPSTPSLPTRPSKANRGTGSRPPRTRSTRSTTTRRRTSR